MKKTTKRLVIFLVCFVMLLTAVAVAVSAKGAAVPPVNDGEIINEDGSITTKHGIIESDKLTYEVEEDGVSVTKNYPFFVFEYQNVNLTSVIPCKSLGLAIKTAKNHQGNKANRSTVIYMRDDYTTANANITDDESVPGDRYNNWAQLGGVCTIDLNGHTLTQGVGTTALFYPITNKPLEGKVFSTEYAFENGNIVLNNKPMFSGNMWNALYRDENGARVTTVYGSDGKGISGVALMSDDGGNTYYIVDSKGTKLTEVYHDAAATKLITGKITPFETSMADKNFTWSFENVNFSYADKTIATANMLMTYTTPQSIAINPPKVAAPFNFNYTNCTFDLTNAPVDSEGKPVPVTLFNAAPSADTYIKSTVTVAGCDIKATKEQAKVLNLYEIEEYNGSSVTFKKNEDGDALTLTLPKGEVPAIINPSYLTIDGNKPYWTNVDGGYSITIAIGKDEMPVVPTSSNFVTLDGKQLYWHMVDGNYLLAECVINDGTNHACSCGRIYTACTDADDDDVCDECGAEHIGDSWLPTEDVGVYPFVVLDAEGKYYDKYQTYGTATAAVRGRNNFTIVVRRDYRFAKGDNTNLKNHSGHFTIDLAGHTLTRDIDSGIYLFDNYCDASTTKDAITVTVKNGNIDVEKWLICLSGSSAMANPKEINFNFEDVTFKFDEDNNSKSGWLLDVHIKEYNKKITSNITFTDCTFDTTDMRSSLSIDSTPIINLDVTNKYGIDYVKASVNFNGGKIIAERFGSKALIQYHDDDVITFAPGTDGKYITLEMPDGKSPIVNNIPNNFMIDGETAYFHKDADGNTYTLSKCGAITGTHHRGECGCIVETCYDIDQDSICDSCGSCSGYLKDTYGIDSIPDQFASAEAFPFVVLTRQGDTYSYEAAFAKIYGHQTNSAFNHAIYALLSDNHKWDPSSQKYVPQDKGDRVFDEVIIVMRRDYSIKYRRDASDEYSDYHDNFPHAQGNITLDLGGYTLSEHADSQHSIFHVTVKGWQGSGDGVYTFPSTYTFKNGNIKVLDSAFASIGVSDAVATPPEGYTGTDWGWHVKDSVFNLNFESINFGLLEGATAQYLAVQYRSMSGSHHGPEDVGKVNINFTGCTFDLKTVKPTNEITIIDNYAVGKDVDSDITVSGCEIVASDMSMVTVYNTSDTNGTSIVIGQNELTLTMPRGSLPPTRTIIIDTGAEYSFVRSASDLGYDYYILSPTALIGFNLKTNVSLYTNFTYNIEVPTTAYVRAITVNGIDITTASEIVLANAGIKVIDRGNSYLISVSIPAGNTLNDIPVTVTFTSGTTTLTATYTLSVLEYAKSIIGGKYNEISKTLMKDILVYAYNAHNYFGTNANVKNKLTEIENMLSSYIRKLPTDTSKNSIKNAYFKEVAIYVDETSAFRFYLANSNYTKDDFTFKVGGKTENVVVTQGSDYVQVEVPAYLMLSDVTVTCGETEVGTYNLFSYYDFAVGEKDAKLVRLVESLMKYSVSAKEYRDYIVSGGFGSMFIDAPKLIYPNTPGFNITALFSNGSYYGNVTWSTNHPNVFVEDGKIYAVGNFASETPVTVTAMTEHHVGTVDITVAATNAEGYKYVQNCYSGASGDAITSSGITFKENEENIVGEFVIKGKLNIYDVNTEIGNAQIQFRFKRYWRFLMQDNDSDGIFTLRTYYNNSKIAETAEIYDARNGLTLDWAVVVSGTTAYLYFDGALVSTLDVTGAEYFNLGALRADVLFYDIKLKTKASDEAAYNAAVSEYQHYVNNAERTDVYINDTANVFKDNAGNNLSGDYVVRGSFRIDKLSTTNDPHIQFRFHDKHKFLLMDGNGIDPNDGIFDVIEFVGDNATVTKDNFYNSNTSKVLEWTVVVKDETAYLYLDNKPVGTINLSGLAGLYFNVGALYMDVLFYNFEVVIKAENEAEYNALVEKYL